MYVYKPTRYSSIDSVRNDFLSIYEAANDIEPFDPIDYSSIYGQWLIEFDDDGNAYITELGPNRNVLPTDDEFWDDRTLVFDMSGCTSEDDIVMLFDNDIRPLISK